METKRYHKLVRDKIPAIIAQDGKKATTQKLTPAEYQEALAEKLVEEAKEYQLDRTIEELADIKEVFLAILEEEGITEAEVEQVRIHKAEERGGFTQRIALLKVEG